MVGQAHDEAHVVLDQQDGEAFLLEPGQGLRPARAFPCGAGRRPARRAAAARDRGTARARSRRCAAGRATDCRPAGACAAARPMRSIWRAASSSRRASSPRSRRATLANVPLLPRRCAPSATFSSTLMSGSTLTCWKVRPMPRRATSCEEPPGDALALEARSRPPVGHSTPVTRLKMVLLPAPLGPIRPTISRGPHVEADVVDGDQAAELLARRLAATAAASPRGRHGAARAAVRPAAGRGGAARAGNSAAKPRPQPLARGLQQQHQQRAEHDDLVVAPAAEQLRQDALQLILEQRDEARRRGWRRRRGRRRRAPPSAGIRCRR